jgi:rRNA maturation endonuclease Nob1
MTQLPARPMEQVQHEYSPPFTTRRNPYKTQCPGCNSFVHLPLPLVHCPSCHHVYRAKRLTSPTRCPRCDFNLFRWRATIGVIDTSALAALQ